MSRTLRIDHESWPIAGEFRIARGAKRSAEVIVAEIGEDGLAGRGECVPYGRYGETLESVAAALEAMTEAIAAGLSRCELLHALPPGAARNALDCALWDLEAKRGATSAGALAQIARPRALLSAVTISLGSPDEMANAAQEFGAHRLLKLKLGAEGDAERLAAVRRARPDARLIIDANEGWRAENLDALFGAAAAAGVELIEQPLPAGADGLLAELEHPCPICADEALDPGGRLKTLAGRYEAVNIKLDKAGGLTAALAQIEQARTRGLTVMVGCMVATSLAMAPAHLAAQTADWVDLDGPLLLENDREHGLAFAGDMVEPPKPALWG